VLNRYRNVQCRFVVVDANEASGPLTVLPDWGFDGDSVGPDGHGGGFVWVCSRSTRPSSLAMAF
jgi:hypothetical protein